MRLLLGLLILSLSFLPVSAAPARVAYAMATGVHGAAATTSPIDTTGASLLWIGLGNGNTGSTSVSDSKGNTWHTTTIYNRNGSTLFTMLYSYDHGGSSLSVGAGHTVTVTGWDPGFAFVAYSGTLTSGDPYDQHNGANAGDNNIYTGSITPSANGALVLVGYNVWNATTTAIDSSFVLVDAIVNSSSSGNTGFAQLVQITAVPINAHLTLSWYRDAAVMIASFKPAAASHPTGNPIILMITPALFDWFRSITPWPAR